MSADPSCDPLLPPPTIDHGPPLGKRQHIRFPAPPPIAHSQRTRAIISAEKLTLDRDERHELAELLTGHEGSWESISEDDARRVADACEAFIAIQALLRMRRRT